MAIGDSSSIQPWPFRGTERTFQWSIRSEEVRLERRSKRYRGNMMGMLERVKLDCESIERVNREDVVKMARGLNLCLFGSFFIYSSHMIG